MINYGRHFIDSDDIASVIKVLKSDYLTQGHVVEKFENKLKLYLKADYCTAVSNGTAALHIAGIALNWKRGDIVLTSPISFVATGNSILYTGATPEFVDIEEDYFTIDPQEVEKKIKKFKNKIKAIIGVDYAGHPCDWKSLKNIANKNNIFLINDNCHALGSSINNDFGYQVKYADIVTQSFHPVKHITTGEGGALLTNNKFLDKKFKILRTHGIEKKFSKKMWLYDMKMLGFNYRITDFQSALGISQLKKIKIFLKKRLFISSFYNKSFDRIKNIQIPKIKENFQHSYHLYPLRIDFKKFNISKELFFIKMKRKRINLQVHYRPIYLNSYYKKICNIKLAKAENFYNQEVSLPIFYSLTINQLRKIVKSVKSILKLQ